MPLAFVYTDFRFFDSELNEIPHEALLEPDGNRRIQFVEIRFRFDKGPTNFAHRKYARSLHDFLDPVQTAIHIVIRALRLDVPDTHPMGVFAGAWQQNLFLWDEHVKEVMRAACVEAYPDPNHYLRLSITRIRPHGNQVTAAVSLKAAGATNEELTYRLR